MPFILKGYVLALRRVGLRDRKAKARLCPADIGAMSTPLTICQWRKWQCLVLDDVQLVIVQPHSLIWMGIPLL